MTVFGEFVGGPLDGRIIELAEALPTIHVPLPTLGHYLTSHDPSQLHYGSVVYERSERRKTPTDDLIFRYRSEEVRLPV